METARDLNHKIRRQVARQLSSEDNSTCLRQLVVQIKDRVGGWWYINRLTPNPALKLQEIDPLQITYSKTHNNQFKVINL